MKRIAILILFLAISSYGMPAIKSSTHTVLAELGAVSWCPHCPYASEKIYEIFNSGDIDFYYVTLVYDKNPIAQVRGRWLNDVYIPMLYIDGGYKVIDDRNRFAEELKNAGAREVRDISLNISAQWIDENKIGIEVEVENREGKPYVGHLRIYVTEIESRWLDEAGKPFHYAFLDFAFNRHIIAMPGISTTKAIWDASHASYGQNFEGIREGNIMIVASISNWLPHIQENPWEKPAATKYFITQFVDATCAIAI